MSETPADAVTANPEEVARFAAIAEGWWDTEGEMKPLHQLNPVRLQFIRDRACAHFDREADRLGALSGLTLLDVGCGGGLIAEPLARMGAEVTAIDAAKRNIDIASIHAAEQGLDIDYHHATPEQLLNEPARYDVVTVMEVVEHVDDVELFLRSCARLVKPGGVVFAATLNRTVKSLAMAKIGAEYILRWLPRGTHDWKKFVKPSELAGPFRREGVELREVAGVVYNPIDGDWRLDNGDLDVNYLAWFARPTHID